MKKIFLSLSAIALLAVGTVSCGGSDDSSPEPGPGPGPGPEPVEQTMNTILYDGEEFEVDYQHTGVEFTTYGTGADAFTAPNIYTSPEEPTKAFEKYTQLTAKIVNNALADYTIFSYYAHNPTVTYNAEGLISSFGDILTPAQVTETEMASAGVRIGGTVLHNSLGPLNEGVITYQTYVIGEEVADTTEEFEYQSQASYNYYTAFDDATISTKVSNIPGFFYGDLVAPTSSKLPSYLVKNLSQKDQETLKSAIRKSQKEADLKTNLKAYKGKVAIKK